MCFSAEASFTASVLLGITGYFTIKKAQLKKTLLALAFIPIFFALQQFSEGVIWLSFSQTWFSNFLDIFKQIFLFFAIFFWPFWIPFSLYMAEEETSRKKWLGFFLGTGITYIGLVLWLFFQIETSANVGIEIFDYSIQYHLPGKEGMLPKITAALYLIATLPAPFFSSVRWIWLMGIANIIGFAVAQYLFSVSFISVWCFFAACVSVCLYLAIYQEVKSLDKVKV